MRIILLFLGSKANAFLPSLPLVLVHFNSIYQNPKGPLVPGHSRKGEKRETKNTQAETVSLGLKLTVSIFSEFPVPNFFDYLNYDSKKKLTPIIFGTPKCLELVFMEHKIFA